jgi:PAS domain S-box-containing protein
MSILFEDKIGKALVQLIDSHASILITDKNGSIVFVNDEFCKTSKFSKEELLGKNPRIMNSGVHDSLFFKNLWDTLLLGNVWKGTVCNRTKTGELVWLETIIKPVFNDNSEINQFIAIRFNITESVSLKSKFKTQEQQLISASKYSTIGEMAAFIGHEINNPLTVLALLATAFDSAIEPTVNKEKLHALILKMKGVVDKIIIIAGHLRNIARSESNDLFETISVEYLLEEAMSIVGELVKKKNIRFKIENNVACKVGIQCHPNEISQILINLVKNSYDAISGCADSWVVVRVNNINEHIEFRIIDSGPQIPVEISKNFFRSSFTTKGKGEGTGIGLIISQRIAQEHKGNLYFDSSNTSTCFVLTLPCVKTLELNLEQDGPFIN